MKIGVLISSNISGGNNVIIEHLSRINERKNNIDVTFIIYGDIKDDCLSWQPAAKNIRKISMQNAYHEFFDVVMASFWSTAFELYKFNTSKYLFFNQCLESEFYPDTNKPKKYFAEAAYMLGINTITEVQWLADYMKKNYGNNAVVIRNGINKNNFSPDGKSIEKRDPKKLRVLVEGNINMERKNVPLSIKLAKESKADEIWLLTSSKINSYDGVDRVFSQISNDKVQEVYRSCDVLVKLSTMEGMFGPPLEMFHCGGTAIAWDVNGHDEYMVNGENSIVIPMYKEKEVVDAINDLKNHPEKLKELKEAAIRTANNWHDWEVASIEFENSIINSLQLPQPSKDSLEHQSRFFTNWHRYSENLLTENNNIKRKIGYKTHEMLIKYFKK